MVALSLNYDEAWSHYYLIFECPQLQPSRELWSHLVEGPLTMQAFIWQDVLIGVAKFVNACVSQMSRWKAKCQASDQPGVAGRDLICSDLICFLILERQPF